MTNLRTEKTFKKYSEKQGMLNRMSSDESSDKNSVLLLI